MTLSYKSVICRPHQTEASRLPGGVRCAAGSTYTGRDAMPFDWIECAAAALGLVGFGAFILGGVIED